MRITVLTLVITAFLAASTASGQTVQPKSLFSSGGQLMTDGATQVNANLGDVFTGVSFGGTTEVQHGFWTSPENQVIGVDGPKLTLVFYLSQAQPNPARTSTTIEFGLPVEEPVVTLNIYDVSGRLVRRLFNGKMNAGVFRQTWDLRNDAGTRMPAGLYFSRLTASSFRAVRKIVVIN
ncbi:MAG: T9SS type A sorting domain-containing protein [Candidatus Kerfeldbacteria bacterium]|nr:T9SS type A sorting domain-containing protein [Candidatus Kerfeldbacteria bacterium]